MIRHLLSQVSSIAIALLFAVIVWVVATNEENPVSEGFFSDPVPISYLNRAEGLVLVNRSANSAQLRIRASASSWRNLGVSNFTLTADLTGVSAGEHQVPLAVKSADPRIRVLSIDPPAVRVQLEPTRRVPISVSVRVLDEPPLGYEMKAPELNPTVVNVVGPENEVDLVNDATVEIALRGAKTTIEREASVALHDAQGNALPNLRIEPATVKVRIPVEQRVGYKDVAIKAVIEGNVTSGYWVSDISVVPASVTLVGNPAALSQIGGFVETEPVSVANTRENVSKRVNLVLPENVSVLNASDIIVRVAVEPVLGGLTIRREVSVSNLNCTLPVTVSPDVVEVILSGPLPILQSLTPDQVQIVVDVPECQSGSYQSVLRAVNVPDQLKVESIVPSTTEVNLKGETKP